MIAVAHAAVYQTRPDLVAAIKRAKLGAPGARELDALRAVVYPLVREVARAGRCTALALAPRSRPGASATLAPAFQDGKSVERLNQDRTRTRPR